MFNLIENNEEDQTYKEEVTYKNTGLDLLPVWNPDENDIKIENQSYSLKSSPGTSKMVILRAKVAGYGMSCSMKSSFE